MKHCYGKYRGTVKGRDVDPSLSQGRLHGERARSVMGATGVQLAMPCFPYAGRLAGTFSCRR